MGDLDWLSAPAEHADAWLTGLLTGAPLALALAIAFLLGLRHATDPDHLVAVTSLTTSEGARGQAAARMGAWWGIGHAAMLVLVGTPLILLEARLPGWLETGAERVVGVVIVVLALRVLLRWARPRETRPVRSCAQAAGIGMVHGLAGTGAVVLVLFTALPSPGQALAALAVFAPMTVVSMAACSGGFAWVLTRPRVEPVFRAVLTPALGGFALLFGLWYAGLA